MKQTKLLAVILSVALLTSGCGAKVTDSKQIDDLKKQVAELQKENDELKAKLGGSASDTSKQTPANNNANTAESETKLIELNKTINEGDFCDFTLKKVEFSKVIKPPKINGVYTYYEAKQTDTTYLHLVTAIKNLQATGKSADSFASVTAKYNNKYEYTSFSTIEDRGGADFTYTNITDIDPLKIGSVHFLFEVPTAVANGSEPLTLHFSINGKEYQYKVR